jgi:DNA-binding beta-propeller fold protein YncE
MPFVRIFVRTIVCVAAAASLSVLPAHAEGQGKGKKEKGSKTPATPLVWPLPPERPRVRYVTAYRGVGDFKPAKRPSRLLAALVGAPDDADKPSDTLIKPYGIAVSRNGRVYVSDTAARRVFVFDPELKVVGFVGEEGATRLTKPVGVAVDDDDRVFVADSTAKRVFGFGPDGMLVLAIGHDGELESPSGLALDKRNHRVYVADAAKHQVLCYSSLTGESIRTIGKRGPGDGEFNFPTNLFVDGTGRLYVADTLNFRIQVFDEQGAFVRTFGQLGDGPGDMNRPKGVAVDSEGHIYVADSSFNNFQIFDSDGRLLLFVGAGGANAGEFVLPAGLYIDERDRIYIADQGNARVQVFQYLPAEARGGTAQGGVNK